MKNIKRLLWSLGWRVYKVGNFTVTGLTMSLLLIPSAHAQSPVNAAATASNLTSVNDIICYIYYGFDLLFWILMALATIMVIVGAYSYLTSQGDPEKVKKGTRTLTWAAIAIAVALIAYNVPDIVGSFFNAPLNGSGATCVD